MKFIELPQEVQNKLLKESKKLYLKKINDSYEISLYGLEGTRHFRARRIQKSWQDNKGNYMPFGGGSEWFISFNFVSFRSFRNVCGGKEYELCDGNPIKRIRTSKGELIEIPNSVKTKKEVLDLLKKIEFSNIPA